MEAMEALAVSPNKNFRIPRILKNLGSNPLEILNLLRSQKPWERVQHHLPEQPVSKGCPDAGPASRRAAAARPSELAAGSSPAVSQGRNDCLPSQCRPGQKQAPATRQRRRACPPCRPGPRSLPVCRVVWWGAPGECAYLRRPPSRSESVPAVTPSRGPAGRSPSTRPARLSPCPPGQPTMPSHTLPSPSLLWPSPPPANEFFPGGTEFFSGGTGFSPGSTGFFPTGTGFQVFPWRYQIFPVLYRFFLLCRNRIFPRARTHQFKFR